jgi:dihydroorotate dehydrogenase
MELGSIPKIGLKFLGLLDPERAHRFALRALQSDLLPPPQEPDDPVLHTQIFGRDLANPIGMAAGFDKNAEVAEALFRQGFGLVEVGTVTPKPQAGNPKPRVFRLTEDEAVINSLGFNNDGLDVIARRFSAFVYRPGLLGANIGANRGAEDAIADYVAGIDRLAGLADYLAINVSSPNTPGLREWQERANLDSLLGSAIEARAKTAASTPLLLKISPDLDRSHIEAIAEVALRRRVDGLIVCNTTIGHRQELLSTDRGRPGGLSGKPLFAPATALLAEFYRLTKGRLVLFGVGGVKSAEQAYAKIRAGASAVQLYTALIFEGPDLIARLKRDLACLLEADGLTSVNDAVGVDCL